MKDAQPKEIRLADYQAPSFTTVSTNLTFDIKDGQTTVSSLLQVERLDDNASSIILDGQDLELVTLRVDGRELGGNEYSVDEESLIINGLSAEHQIEIVTHIKPEENTALEGLYRSSKMYCTQCEAQGFRKITYYQDRPDVLAKFTTTIIADTQKCPTLLSNGNMIATEDLADGRSRVTWQDPFPKPSYLFALVAGDLEKIEDTFTTQSGREIRLEIFSEPHNIGQCDYAMDVLKRSMAWDEQQYGREYDLDIFMIVAVEDFNMGAMENKGLNIFNTSCVLASPNTATDAAYQRVEAVVAHEYFHNWSGNRVTCRDWFQLSLKEGFTVYRDAQFSSDMNSAAVKRIDDVRQLRAVQFAEDAGPLAHPVRPQSYIEISNFYTTTIYEKGAEVVRMYNTLLGDEQFRAGSDLYFDRFDGSAATTDDFTQAMADVSGLDLEQFKRWYDQAGTPTISVSEQFSDGCLTLTVQQDCAPTPQQPTKLPFHMPIVFGLLDASGEVAHVNAEAIASDQDVEIRDAGASIMLHLRDAQAQVKIEGFTQRPVISFLRGFSAPVKVAYERDDDQLAFLVEYDVDGFVRWDALQSLWVKLFEGCLDNSVDYIGLVGRVGEQILQRLTNDNEQQGGVSAEMKLLAATMLSVPDENYLFEQMAAFDVDQLITQREELLNNIAQAHGLVWQAIYTACYTHEAYSPDADGIANRALGSVAFAYRARALAGAELNEFVKQHYQNADNLTDRRAAMAQVCQHSGIEVELRDWMLNDFYNHWSNEALVMDLWFSLQAQSGLTTVADLHKLEQHSQFDIKNPNRARSVIAAFGMNNHKQFHALDGSGYAYLKDAIARLDALNPQLAARLATPLTRWQRYDVPRQGLMQTNLKELQALPNISKDLYEIVAKSLS